MELEDADDAHAQPKPLPRRIRKHMERSRVAPMRCERRAERRRMSSVYINLDVIASGTTGAATSCGMEPLAPHLRSAITCPHCARVEELAVPIDACLFFHECAACHVMLRPKAGDCCVFCSYGTVPCPSRRGVTPRNP
ncbi:MAG: GDCCVxC domain-containing (seleno)protein [Gemmatimonadales bacterium]